MQIQIVFLFSFPFICLVLCLHPKFKFLLNENKFILFLSEPLNRVCFVKWCYVPTKEEK